MYSDDIITLIGKKRKLFFEESFYFSVERIISNFHRLTDSSPAEKLYLLRHISLLDNKNGKCDLQETLYYSSSQVARDMGFERTTLYKIEQNLIQKKILRIKKIDKQKAHCFSKSFINFITR